MVWERASTSKLLYISESQQHSSNDHDQWPWNKAQVLMRMSLFHLNKSQHYLIHWMNILCCWWEWEWRDHFERDWGLGLGTGPGLWELASPACESAITETWRGAHTDTGLLYRIGIIFEHFMRCLWKGLLISKCRVSYHQALGKNLSLLRK